MRKMLSVLGVLVIALVVASPAAAQFCYDEATQACAAKIGEACPEGTIEILACPPAPPEPSWMDGIAIRLSETRLASILALLLAMAGTIQLIKQNLGAIAKWGWLLKLFPPAAAVLKFLSEGIGPVILNVAMTLTVVLPPLIADRSFSLGDALVLGGMFVGNIAAFVGLKATIASWSGKKA